MLKAKDRHGVWLIGGVLVALILIVGVKFSLDGRPKAKSNNCVGDPVANTVILLDYTDQVPLQTHDEIVSRAMAHVLKHVKVNEMVGVFTINARSKEALRPVVAVCRPPQEANPLIEDPQKVRKAFEDNFENPLRKALAEPARNSPESPIAQALIDISLSQYLRGPTNTLLVFSDMLENTPRFTMYHCPSSTTVVQRFRDSRKGAQERPHFQNTAVILNRVPRLDQSRETLQCRDVLWAWFFGDNDGPNAKLIPDYLPGGTPMGGAPDKAGRS